MPSNPSPDFTLDYAEHQVGGVLTPLGPSAGRSSSNPLLQDADPALFYLLDFWSSMVQLYEGARILQVASAIHLKRPDGTAITSAVAQQYPWVPDLELEANQFGFPLLACYRKDSTYRSHTAGYDDDTCTFDLLYILPPMSAGQLEQMAPVLRAVEGTLRKATVRGFDPNWQPVGGNYGDALLAVAGLESLFVDRGHYSTWKSARNINFPMLHMEGRLLEQDGPIHGHTFAGADTSVGLFGHDGTIVPDLIDQSTQEAPTITGVSPAVGPVAGGTSITVTGTLFLTGPIVYVGTQRAFQVTWNSATSLTVVTPAGANPGAVSLTILNRDGQSVSLASAFTYQ